MAGWSASAGCKPSLTRPASLEGSYLLCNRCEGNLYTDGEMSGKWLKYMAHERRGKARLHYLIERVAKR